MRQWSLTIGLVALVVFGVAAAFGAWAVNTFTDNGAIRVAASDGPFDETTPALLLDSTAVRPILQLYPHGSLPIPLPADGQCRQTLTLADRSLSVIPLVYVTPAPTPTAPQPPAVAPTLTPTPPPSLAQWRGRPIALVTDGLLSLTLPKDAAVQAALEAQTSLTGHPNDYHGILLLTVPTATADPSGEALVRLSGHALGVIDQSAPEDLHRVDHHRLVLTLEIAGAGGCESMYARWERPPQAEIVALSADPATEWAAALPAPPDKQLVASISAVWALACVRDSTTTASVSWVQPAYMVGTTISGSQVTVNAATTDVAAIYRAYEVTGLTPDTAQDVSVRALGNDGTLGDDTVITCPAT